MKIITIKDYYGNYQEVPVDDALYAEWQELQRESDRIRKKEYYHGSGVPFDTVESCSGKTSAAACTMPSHCCLWSSSAVCICSWIT